MRYWSFFFFLLLISPSSQAAELTGRSYWDGLNDGIMLMGKGGVLQFREKNNLYAIALAVPALWFSFEEDKRIIAHARTKAIPKYMQISSDLAPALSFPVIQVAFLTYGIKQDDDRAVQFAKETFGAMYLALVESAALSLIDVHERPDKSNLSKWETNFRGDSSFPSGHVVPYATLALKTFQFYGPWYAIAPGALFIATSIQRVRDEKHYLSDVIGGFFLSVFASEGVRKAAEYKDNHPLYKELFVHDVEVGVIQYNGVMGPRIVYRF